MSTSPMTGPNLPTREQRINDAAEVKRILRLAHRARNSNEMMRGLADFAPVPALRVRAEDPSLMILAYALLVDELMQEMGVPQVSMFRAATEEQR